MKKNKNWWIWLLLGIVLIFIIYQNSLPHNTYLCYQETANAKSINDGKCALNFNGAYGSAISYSDSWHDGDWNTSSTGNYNLCFNNGNLLYVNYSVPRYAQNSSLFQIKYSYAIFHTDVKNYSVIQCWDNKKLMFRFGAYPGNCPTQIDCFNGTSWYNLYKAAGMGTGNIYEEAMIWNVTK